MFIRITVYNVPPSPGRARLHLIAFIGHRKPSQTNTCLFCTLCPHSCAPGKNFPVGHPSQIAPGQARLTLEFFGDWLPEKKLQLVDMSILLILLSPRPGCYTVCVLRTSVFLLKNTCLCMNYFILHSCIPSIHP